MRRILPFLTALAACAPPAARPAPRSAAPAARPEPEAPAELRARVPHLAPGDPVELELRFGPDLGAAARVEIEVALARPDGTTSRARTAASGADPVLVELPAGLDLSLAGRYRVSLAGVAHGRAARRFATGAIEIEVMGDGRLPLGEIERRARRALEGRGLAPGPAVVSEAAGGEREVRFAAGGAVHVVRVTPAGAVRTIESARSP